MREGAGTQYGLVAGAPLKLGTEVEILERGGQWALIRTPDARVEGWAFARYLVG